MEAKEHTTYYAEALAGFSRAAVDEIAGNLELSALPRLEKRALRENTAAFYNRSRSTAARTSTSGSTGSPLTVPFDRDSVQMRMALVHRHRQWLDLEPRARSVRLSGREIVPVSQNRPPFWVWNPFESQLLVSTYHLRREAMPHIASRIMKYAPRVIDGYPTAIAQIAAYFAEEGLELASLRGVITTAETLDPELRSTIERGFRVPVLDYYSASEGVPLIQQCPRGRYHLRVESGIFEILDGSGEPVSAGEMGELVVTSFMQWKTPLIRYRTGDYALAGSGAERCPCGRTLPTVDGVVGRREDLIVTPDGRLIGMFSYRTLKNVTGIREAQIVQEGLTRFRVRLVYDGHRPPGEVNEDLRRVFARVLGYEPAVLFEELDEIPRGPSGKFRSTVGLPLRSGEEVEP